MTFQDFNARAELYLGSDRQTAIAQGARGFASAAQAIRFAFEEAAPVSLNGAMLRVGDATYAGDDLAALYRSAEFPLPRRHDIKRARARRAAHRYSWSPAPARAEHGPQHAARA
jgi:hypothetical protein